MPPAHETTLPAARRTRKSTSGSSPTKTTDKENATIDFGASGATASMTAASRKKSRSKSMGPGGLDSALKSTSGNRRVSLAVPSRPPPRSILKPTMPILADIPPLKSKAKAKSQSRGSPMRGTDDGTKIALRTEEEQQAAAREREREERERAAREKEVNAHREARRKSLANRRVSFAAEATLHTFHEIEYMPESTTSTDSTTQRTSAVAAAPSAAFEATGNEAGRSARNGQPTSPDNVVLSTPPEQLEDDRKKRRRSSTGASVLGFRNTATLPGDDNTITSTVYDSDGDGVEEDDDNSMEEEDMESDRSDSDSDEGDGATMVTVEGDEMTSASMMSAISAMSAMSAMSGRSASPIESTGDLDEALRLATQHAGAEADRTRRERPVGEDEEVIPAFVGWGKKANASAAAAQSLQPQPQPQPQPHQDDTEASLDMDMDMDTEMGMEMEMTHAIGGIIRDEAAEKLEDEMSMDVTRVYGGIIAQLRQPLDTDSVPSSPMVMSDDGRTEEVPMELTMAVGGIRAVAEPETEAEADADADAQSFFSEGLEDMSMELTTVMGGVLSAMGANKQRRQSRRQTIRSTTDGESFDEAPMDMTVGVGQILSAQNPEDEAEEAEAEGEMDMTMGMEMTTALGGILQPAKEMAASTPTSTARLETMSSPVAVTAAAKRSLDRTPLNSTSTTSTNSTTPVGEPLVRAPATPLRSSSPVRFIGSRSKSPKSPKRKTSPAKSPTRSPARTAASTTPRSSALKPNRLLAKSLFKQNPDTGMTTPSVVLTPQQLGRQRPSAYTGAGPASPKITEIFSRRSSLINASADFVVGSASKQDRSEAPSGEPEPEPEPEPQSARHQSTPEQRPAPAVSWAQDDREATQNLRELIQGLSPKKKPLKGRKSLHVGSARGLLGKRPLELEDDDGDEGDNSNSNNMNDDEGIYESQDLVKRLKGNEPSPVKNIRLQQPPSMMETIGRSSRSRKSPSATQPLIDISLPDTPRRGVEDASNSERVKGSGSDEGGGGEEGDQDSEGEGEHIHLQDFLNMASIHFMELETTKRRPTEMTRQAEGSSNGDNSSSLTAADKDMTKDPETEELVTSVCKVPLLEMYQHACRELKNYIEEGRAIMREIETETYEENPAIFREYMTATPALRTQMDNQFKNIKIFARLQSKKQWYEWRTKLQQGLQEGMHKTLRELERDRSVLQGRRKAVDAAYPQLLAEYEAAAAEMARLMAVAQQVGGEEREAMAALQQKKRQLQTSVAARKRETARLQAEAQASRARVAAMKTEREQHLQELEEAKRVQEERRSWSHQEITTLKAQVEALERKSGWAVTGAQGTTLSLAYWREIELVFDVRGWGEAADRRDDSGGGGGSSNSSSATTDLWYIGGQAGEVETFLLQCLRDHVRALRPETTTPARLLRVVRASWDAAKQTTTQIRQLQRSFPTTLTKTSDTSMAVTASVLLVPLQTKIELTVHVRGGAGGGGSGGSGPKLKQQLPITLSAEARVAYGEPFKAAKLSEFLTARIGERVVAGKSRPDWVDVVEELRRKLQHRGEGRS